MARNSQFVDSTNLLKIKDKLGAGKQFPANDDGGNQAEKHPEPENRTAASPALDKTHLEALYRRRDEFRSLRRDVITRLTERLAVIPEEMRSEEERCRELRQALESYAELRDELEGIDERNWNRDDFGSELGAAMKKLENGRLEFLRLNARLESLQKKEKTAGQNLAPRSLIPEFNSLNWTQAFRLGMMFMLPLIIAIILGSIILAVVIFISYH